MAIATPASSRRQPEPEINVTPLVDVVLVLLIIFMVIAPALEHGERVELPSILNVDPKPKQKLDPVTVTIGGTGNLYLEKEPLDQPTLLARLDAIHAAEPDRKIVLKGDGAVPYAKVRGLFAVIQDRGYSGVSLQVQKKKGQGPESAEE